MLLLLYLSSCLSDKAFWFLQESDEGKFPSQFRSPDLNGLILSAIKNSNSASHIAFDTDSFSAISDCGASSSATPFLEDYVPGTYKPLKGITISGITSGLSASGIGTVIYKIKDDNGELFDLQIDKVLHLKQLPTRLVSPQQILQQHKSFKNDFTMNHNYAWLHLQGMIKTLPYDPATNLSMLYMESGLNKLYNLTLDGSATDPLLSN